MKFQICPSLGQRFGEETPARSEEIPVRSGRDSGFVLCTGQINVLLTWLWVSLMTLTCSQVAADELPGGAADVALPRVHRWDYSLTMTDSVTWSNGNQGKSPRTHHEVYASHQYLPFVVLRWYVYHIYHIFNFFLFKASLRLYHREDQISLLMHHTSNKTKFICCLYSWIVTSSMHITTL